MSNRGEEATAFSLLTPAEIAFRPSTPLESSIISTIYHASSTSLTAAAILERLREEFTLDVLCDPNMLRLTRLFKIIRDLLNKGGITVPGGRGIPIVKTVLQVIFEGGELTEALERYSLATRLNRTQNDGGGSQSDPVISSGATRDEKWAHTMLRVIV
jgi:hypothetical protein